MDLLFAYLAGLLTLINPCVLPVLPIVLGASLQAGRGGPVALAAGMAVSFVVLGVGVTAFGHLAGIDERTVARAGAALMIVFGIVLMVPRASAAFATATGGFAAGADNRIRQVDQTGIGGQVAGGVLLGAVWSPCIGPTLGGAIALASQGQDLGRATLIMAAFALGVATLIVGLGAGARGVLGRHMGALRALSARARPALGAIFAATGLALLFNLHHVVEGWAVDHMPDWLLALSVSI